MSGNAPRPPLAATVDHWLRLLRLHRPADLALLWLLSLWGLWLGSGGHPAPATLGALLLGGLLLRGAAWLVHDVVNTYEAHPKHDLRSVLRALPAAMRWAIALVCSGALAIIAALGWQPLLIAGVAALVGLFYLWARRHTFLAELLLALAIGSASVVGFSAAGAVPNKTAWLVYTAAVLWVTAYLTQYAALHLQLHARLGVRSLAMLFGPADRWLVATLQASALLALYLAARQESFGVFMWLGMTIALLLALYQQWLMQGGNDHGYRRAYLNNIWFGIALFCGIAFHYLCKAQGHC